MKKFDVIVIGKGLVGTASAKYLSDANSSVAIVGPDEPANYQDAIVFASHYDQARVQRMIGKDQVWTRLNLDSIKAYESIQQETGVQFYEPNGCLYVNPHGEDEYLLNARNLSQQFHLSPQFIQGGDRLKEVFSKFHFPEHSVGMMEKSPSGTINPTKLIEAQLFLCKNNGVGIYNDTVLQLEKEDDNFKLTTASGETLLAKKVLVATGSFLNVTKLLPNPVQLQTKNEVVVLVKIDPSLLDQFSDMPSLLYEKNKAGVDGIYVLKPVLYPDGNYYIKLGCNMPNDFYFDNLEQIQHWFKEANTESFETYLLNEMKLLFPSLVINEYQIKKCIISRTSHGRPIIGETQQQGLYISGGCNGYSAMCSDALGRVTSHLIENNHFPEGYTLDDFEIIYDDKS